MKRLTEKCYLSLVGGEKSDYSETLVKSRAKAYAFRITKSVRSVLVFHIAG